jgi:hypothetical protein
MIIIGLRFVVKIVNIFSIKEFAMFIFLNYYKITKQEDEELTSR